MHLSPEFSLFGELHNKLECLSVCWCNEYRDEFDVHVGRSSHGCRFRSCHISSKLRPGTRGPRTLGLARFQYGAVTCIVKNLKIVTQTKKNNGQVVRSAIMTDVSVENIGNSPFLNVIFFFL